MELKDFVDMQEFEKTIANWAVATGLAVVAVGNDGKHISKCYNDATKVKDFEIDLILKGEKVGSVIGGQASSEEKEEEKIVAASELLGQALNNFISVECSKRSNGGMLGQLTEGVEKTNILVEEIKKKTGELRSIQGKQKILALNASIEAARAGEMGAGFAVVAGEVGKLSEKSSEVNGEIEAIVTSISDVVTAMKEI